MKNSLLLLTAIIFTTCRERDVPGTFPDVPVNFTIVNSAYDDYNSASPSTGETSPLCFSSNRYSSVANFDIVYYLLDISENRSSGNISFYEVVRGSGFYSENESINDALPKLNTSSDELGPYLIPKGYKANGAYQSYIFLYSSNKGGNQDIRFLHNLSTLKYTESKPIAFLNSTKDDAYPCLLADSSAVYFCSNRNGNFKIYKAALSKENSVLQNFEDTSPKDILEVSKLSSTNDDKCPFILGNRLVFTSNRPGGFGGFDLYYSIYSSGEWSAPVNFGDKINTPYDEYRPIVKQVEGSFTNNMMIFSSNRPGGKGGFDLYYVGVPKTN